MDGMAKNTINTISFIPFGSRVTSMDNGKRYPSQLTDA